MATTIHSAGGGFEFLSRHRTAAVGIQPAEHSVIAPGIAHSLLEFRIADRTVAVRIKPIEHRLGLALNHRLDLLHDMSFKFLFLKHAIAICINCLDPRGISCIELFFGDLAVAIGIQLLEADRVGHHSPAAMVPLVPVATIAASVGRRRQSGADQDAGCGKAGDEDIGCSFCHCYFLCYSFKAATCAFHPITKRF